MEETFTRAFPILVRAIRYLVFTQFLVLIVTSFDPFVCLHFISEKDSAYITGKLLSAIKYMHDHGIVHR